MGSPSAPAFNPQSATLLPSYNLLRRGLNNSMGYLVGSLAPVLDPEWQRTLETYSLGLQDPRHPPSQDNPPLQLSDNWIHDNWTAGAIALNSPIAMPDLSMRHSVAIATSNPIAQLFIPWDTTGSLHARVAVQIAKLPHKHIEHRLSHLFALTQPVHPLHVTRNAYNDILATGRWFTADGVVHQI